jgi:thiol-disulfide isomerase/thioredoxin
MRRLVIALSVSIACAGCRSGGASEDPGHVRAPGFTEQTLQGSAARFDPSTLRKPTLFAFWASWCTSCRRELPNLIALYEGHRGQLDVIGVNVDKDMTKAIEFAATANIPYESVLDPDLRISDLFDVRKTPTFILVDKNGLIAFTSDELDADLLAAIDHALR